jgi:hypothetical protein
MSWDDSECSGVSHCMLHKSILQVALKCSCIDMTDCLRQFLALGAKVILTFSKPREVFANCSGLSAILLNQ